MSFTCVFQTKGEPPCHPSLLRTFAGIICDAHMYHMYGLVANRKTFDPEQYSYEAGPWLNVGPNLSFEANCVLFPTREFLDASLAIDRSAENKKIEDFDLFHLNPVLDIYLRNLTRTARESNLFKFEIARNLMVRDPNDGVNMSLNSDPTKSNLKTEVQTRLNHLKSKIANSDWFPYCANNIAVIGYPSGNKPELSAFESFLLFNFMPDQMFLNDKTYRPQTLNYNLVYVEGIGYAISRKIMHPLTLVVMADYTMSQNYGVLKTARRLKKHTGTKSLPKEAPDSQNVMNLYQTIC